jgi:hypothetical protein
MAEIIVVTSEDLKKQRISGFDFEKEITNPRDSIDPDLLFMLEKAEGPFLIEYGGVKVLSRQSEFYPNPTFNHFALANHLKNSRVTSKKIIDLGCGVGFLGNYGAVNLNPETVIFSDLNPDALNQSLYSYTLNNSFDESAVKQQPHKYGARFDFGKHTIDLRVGNSAETLINYDAEGCVSLCAPMYIPGICEVFPQAFSFFASVAKNTGSRLFIGHSNLTSKLVENAAEANNLNLRSREENRVPFMVEYVDSRKDLIQEELISKGLEFDKFGKAYHRLMVSELYD